MRYALLVFILILVGCQHAPQRDTIANQGTHEGVPAFKKVVLVLFENEDFEEPLAQPFFARLAHDGALLTNYHAITHPSQPNYIALVAGDTYQVRSDSDYDLRMRHVGDLLEDAGKTWKNYAEAYPGHCFPGARSGRYVRKHAPFMSFLDVTMTERCRNVVNASEFETDVERGTLPDFSFYTPDIKDDAHDTSIEFGDRWFKKTFGPLLTDPRFRDVLLIATFDENSCATVGPERVRLHKRCGPGDSNQVYTAFYGTGVIPGAESDERYDHYSLLRTLESGFGLPTLGRKDDAARAITGIWK